MGQVLASAARTADTTGQIVGWTQLGNQGTGFRLPAHGILFILDITVSGTGTLTPEVQIYDAGQSAWITYAAFAAISPFGSPQIKRLVLHAGEPVAAGFIDEVIARNFPMAAGQLLINHSDGSSWTYSVGSAFYDIDL